VAFVAAAFVAAAFGAAAFAVGVPVVVAFDSLASAAIVVAPFVARTIVASTWHSLASVAFVVVVQTTIVFVVPCRLGGVFGDNSKHEFKGKRKEKKSGVSVSR